MIKKQRILERRVEKFIATSLSPPPPDPKNFRVTYRLQPINNLPTILEFLAKSSAPNK